MPNGIVWKAKIPLRSIESGADNTWQSRVALLTYSINQMQLRKLCQIVLHVAFQADSIVLLFGNWHEWGDQFRGRTMAMRKHGKCMRNFEWFVNKCGAVSKNSTSPSPPPLLFSRTKKKKQKSIRIPIHHSCVTSFVYWRARINIASLHIQWANCCAACVFGWPQNISEWCWESKIELAQLNSITILSVAEANSHEFLCETRSIRIHCHLELTHQHEWWPISLS